MDPLQEEELEEPEVRVSRILEDPQQAARLIPVRSSELDLRGWRSSTSTPGQVLLPPVPVPGPLRLAVLKGHEGLVVGLPDVRCFVGGVWGRPPRLRCWPAAPTCVRVVLLEVLRRESSTRRATTPPLSR